MYQQGAEATEVYIVFDGEFEVQRRKIIGKNDEDQERNLLVSNLRFKKQINLSKKKNYIDLKICMASKGQTLAFEDVINERNYTTSIRCVSTTGQLYCITK